MSSLSPTSLSGQRTSERTNGDRPRRRKRLRHPLPTSGRADANSLCLIWFWCTALAACSALPSLPPFSSILPSCARSNPRADPIAISHPRGRTTQVYTYAYVRTRISHQIRTKLRVGVSRINAVWEICVDLASNADRGREKKTESFLQT